MTGVGEDPWLMRLATSPGAVTLVCIPYAGARPGVFTPLARAFPDLNVLAVQLPGHGKRIRERPFTSMAEVVDGLAPAVSKAVDGKFVLLGHSMGALVGLALARALQDQGSPEPDQEPDHFIASACRAPRYLEKEKPWHKLPEDELIATLIALGAEPEPFQHAELRELSLPVIRADLQVVETFDTAPKPPLRCPITAVAGTTDPESTPELMDGWRRETEGEFHAKTIAGGHYLLEERPADMVNVVRDVLGG